MTFDKKDVTYEEILWLWEELEARVQAGTIDIEACVAYAEAQEAQKQGLLQH